MKRKQLPKTLVICHVTDQQRCRLQKEALGCRVGDDDLSIRLLDLHFKVEANELAHVSMGVAILGPEDVTNLKDLEQVCHHRHLRRHRQRIILYSLFSLIEDKRDIYNLEEREREKGTCLNNWGDWAKHAGFPK